jgi:hypothetical protein
VVITRRLILHPEGDRVTVWRTFADPKITGEWPDVTINMTLSTLGSEPDPSINGLRVRWSVAAGSLAQTRATAPRTAARPWAVPIAPSMTASSVNRSA